MHTRSPCIVHSDFKPGNVFLTDDRETKILDLGIARTIDATMAGTTGTRFKARNPVLALTPEYASCEMFEGRSPDPRDDLYALGCVAYELLTGQHPFDREYAIDARQRQRRPARPKHLRTRAWRALQAALAFDRLDRIASAEEFLTEFGPPESKASARPWILASVGLLAVLAGAGLWIYELRPGPEDQFLEDRLGVETQGDATADDAAFYMEQGDTFLSIAQDKLSGEDPVGALYFLGGATSSAERSFAFVLEHAADDEVRRAAASGLLRVSDAYATAAETLKNNNKIEESLRFVCQGLRLNRYEPRFGAWYKELDGMRPSGSRIEACEGL
jgi:hypothetical protein